LFGPMLQTVRGPCAPLRCRETRDPQGG
jgi:hypothetical protein